MAKLGSLYISLIADTAQFSSGLNKAKGELNSTSAAINRGLSAIDKGFTGLGHSIKDMGREVFSLKGAFTALVGTIGIGSIVEMSKQAVEAVGSLGEMASQVGVTTDTLQSFRYAATQVGVTSEEMDGSLSKLTKTIGLAATGNKTAIDSFNQFGIKVLDAQGNVRSTDDVVRDIADAIEALPDPAQRAAAAVAFFGKAGQRILPFLQDGAKGIDDFVAAAKGLGLVFDEETIRRADDAADKLATLSLVLKTNFQAALVELAPILSEFATEMLHVAGAVHQFFDDIRPDDEKSLDALERKFEKLQDMQDKLGEERDALVTKKSSRGIMDNIFGTDIDAEIQKKETAIAALTVDLVNLRSRIDDAMLAKSEQPASVAATRGVSNPTPTATGQTAAEKNIDKLEDKLRDLQAQLDQLHMGDLEADIDKNIEGFDLSTKAARDLAAQISIVTAEINEKKKAEAEDAQLIADTDKIIADATERRNKALADGKQLTESLRTPQEQLADATLRYGEMLRAGTIDQTTFNRAVAEAKDEFKKADAATVQWSGAMTELGATFTSAFEDAVVQGKSLSEVLNGLLQDVERILLRLAENQILGGASGSGGWLDSIISGAGSILGSFFGGGGGYAGATTAGYQSAMSWGFHGGGSGKGEASFTRAVPAGLFDHAPRFHGGRMAAGEMPAIIRDDESVLTPGQMAQLGPAGGGAPVVQIIDQRGSGKIDREDDTDPSGRQRLKFMLRDEVKTQITSGTLDRSMKGQFGINAQPKRRRS